MWRVDLSRVRKSALKSVPNADSTSRGVAAGRSAVYPEVRREPHGVGSEVRAEQRLAAGGAAPPTRIRRTRRLPFWVVQRFALRLLATAAAVLLASYLFPNLIVVESPARAVVFAIILGILNAFLRPILLLLTLPLNLLTLG